METNTDDQKSLLACQDLSFDPHLQALCQEIEQAQNARRPKLVSQKMGEAFDYIVEIAPEYKDQYLQATANDPTLARRQATESLGLAGDALQDAIGRKDQKQEDATLNPAWVLGKYLEGQACRLAGGCQPLTGTEDNAGALDKTSKGDYGCPVIATKEERAQGLLDVYQGALDRRWSLRALFEQLKDYGVRLSGGPLVSYEGNPEHAFVGVGGFASVTIPYREKFPLVFGAEIQALARWGFDNPDLREGEPKSFQLAAFPVLFQTGYSKNGISLLLQAGGWFSGFKLYEGEQEDTPYAQEDPADNGHLRVGVKASLFDDHLLVSGGYQKSPWGDGGYASVGAQF